MVSYLVCIAPAAAAVLRVGVFVLASLLHAPGTQRVNAAANAQPWSASANVSVICASRMIYCAPFELLMDLRHCTFVRGATNASVMHSNELRARAAPPTLVLFLVPTSTTLTRSSAAGGSSWGFQGTPGSSRAVIALQSTQDGREHPNEQVCIRAHTYTGTQRSFAVLACPCHCNEVQHTSMCNTIFKLAHQRDCAHAACALFCAGRSLRSSVSCLTLARTQRSLRLRASCQRLGLFE